MRHLLAMQLLVANVSMVYENPAPIDDCDQFTQRTVFTLAQLYPQAGWRQINATTMFVANLTQRDQVADVFNNETGGRGTRAAAPCHRALPRHQHRSSHVWASVSSSVSTT
jgi:hypothetical protein